MLLQPFLAKGKGNALDIKSLKIAQLNAIVTIEICTIVPNAKTFFHEWALICSKWERKSSNSRLDGSTSQSGKGPLRLPATLRANICGCAAVVPSTGVTFTPRNGAITPPQLPVFVDLGIWLKRRLKLHMLKCTWRFYETRKQLRENTTACRASAPLMSRYEAQHPRAARIVGPSPWALLFSTPCLHCSASQGKGPHAKGKKWGVKGSEFPLELLLQVPSVPSSCHYAAVDSTEARQRRPAPATRQFFKVPTVPLRSSILFG